MEIKKENTIMSIKVLHVVPIFVYVPRTFHLVYFSKPILEAEEPVEYSGLDKAKRTRATIIAVIFVLIVAAVIAVVVVIARDTEKPKPPFNVEALYSTEYRAKKPHFKWLSDTEYEYKTEEGKLMKMDLTSAKGHVINHVGQFLSNYSAYAYWWSSDQRYVLAAYDHKKIYRHSYFARYALYDVTTRITTLLDEAGQGVRLREMSWSPTGNKLAYVYNNDLYIKNSPTASGLRVTMNGNIDQIYNGAADWAYEEEILSTGNAKYWSPDATYLCYASFNDSHIIHAKWFTYEPDRNGYVAKLHSIPYPKPGTTLPKFTLNVAAISNNNISRIVTLQPPARITGDGNYYYTNVVWPNSNTIIVYWLNRLQNISSVTTCNPQTGDCTEISAASSTTSGGYVDFHYYRPLSSSDGSTLYTILPKAVADKGTFNHIAKIVISTNFRQFLTDGEWEVTSLYGLTLTNDMIYFQSTKQSSTTRHIYSATTSASPTVTCLTCNMFQSGTYSYFSATFSSQASFYFLRCLGPNIPSYYVVTTATSDKTLLENNTELATKLSEHELAERHIYQINSNGYKLNAIEYRPPLFDANKRYPVMLYVYGGPGSQTVKTSWSLGFPQYFSTTLQMVVIRVDPRGTGYRGNKFKFLTYRKIGLLESDDFLNVFRYLRQQSYVDPDKICMFGWSYGGYMTAMVTGRNQGLFKIGFSVAPVANWGFYDAIYSERFLATPSDNAAGYNQSAIVNNLQGFKNKTVSFFIAHGTSDDNVHYSNTAILVEALQNEVIPFRMQAYTNKDHSIRGGANKHLVLQMTDMITKSFGITVSSEGEDSQTE
ncbi:Dipeptidyl peptidase 4 [Trichoplax sp. H2]|nr:Dipeptidyl peptidase 4 [Trichoplax sp. H2]|eukprot:RDD45117.1 Dipeptidyl peptidase 4 [Trichoplax sp. H2]